MHDDSLIHGINYIEEMNEMASIKEIDGNSWVIHDSKKIYDGGSFSIFDFLSKIFHYVIVILSVIIIFLISLLIVKCILRYSNRHRNEDKSYKNFLENYRINKDDHRDLLAENEV